VCNCLNLSTSLYQLCLATVAVSLSVSGLTFRAYIVESSKKQTSNSHNPGKQSIQCSSLFDRCPGYGMVENNRLPHLSQFVVAKTIQPALDVYFDRDWLGRTARSKDSSNSTLRAPATDSVIQRGCSIIPIRSTTTVTSPKGDQPAEPLRHDGHCFRF
jgi:hypothetical protein